jgi:hypothetical protein
VTYRGKPRARLTAEPGARSRSTADRLAADDLRPVSAETD